MMSTPRTAVIGETTFHPASGELVGPAGTTRLAPQPSSLLELLLAHSGDVVARDAIREHLWPDGKVEFDQGIAFAVREVRKGLEEVGGDPDLLETIPRRGLRLRRAATAPADRAASTPAGHSRPLLLAASLVLLGITAVLVLPRLTRTSPPVVAIFAHDARGPAPAAEIAARLGAALTTSLTSSLDDVAGVIGPTGTATLTGPDDTNGARARLGACLLLSGSVGSTGTDSLVVFTQIVRAEDRVHVWAELDTLPMSAGLDVLVTSIESGVRASLPDC